VVGKNFSHVGEVNFLELLRVGSGAVRSRQLNGLLKGWSVGCWKSRDGVRIKH